ncbi:MAG: endonuclease/exonuclease/phosphatase family protein [Pseudomonadota bacterium]
MFHADLERDGPGLLLRDITRGEDDDIAATVEIIVEFDPDILLILGFDYDAELRALNAFADALAAAGANYPHLFARRPNAGWPTGVDVDGDGRLAEAQDAHGWGRFNGQGGMAILSRLAIEDATARDFSAFLWRDLPGSRAETVLSPEAAAILRLSTMAIWDVAITTAAGPLHLLAIHAGAPVFDGPEDRNGLRNEDETRFLVEYLNGWSPEGPAFEADLFAVMGTFNVDPERGEGRRAALNALLRHPDLQDPAPRDPDGQLATTNWDEPSPGRLRVDYILPSVGLTVEGAGISHTADDVLAQTASGHRLVWVDIELTAP